MNVSPADGQLLPTVCLLSIICKALNLGYICCDTETLTWVNARVSHCSKSSLKSRHPLRLKPVVSPAGEERHDVVLQHPLIAGVGAKHHHQCREAISLHGFPVQDGDGGEPVGDGVKGAWVDQVRQAPTIFFPVLAVIARGGDGLAVEGEDLLGLAGAAVDRGFDGDAPRAAVRLGAPGVQLAGDFDQVAVDAESLEAVRNLVDDGAGLDAVEFDADRSILAEVIALDAQVLKADVAAQGGKRGLVGLVC